VGHAVFCISLAYLSVESIGSVHSGRAQWLNTVQEALMTALKCCRWPRTYVEGQIKKETLDGFLTKMVKSSGVKLLKIPYPTTSFLWEPLVPI
jgi:hypothetical protein